MSNDGEPSITFLINSLEGGGAERVIVQLANALASEKSYRVDLVLVDDRPEQYKVDPLVNVTRLRGSTSLPSSLFRLSRHLRRTKPKIVISFLSRSNVCNILTAKFFGHVSVISERANTSGHHAKHLKGRIANFIVKAIYGWAAWVIVPSEGVGLDLIENYRISAGKVVRIYNPVDRPSILARSLDPEVVVDASDYYLSVGRLVESKNVEMLIRAFAASQTPRTLLVLGEGRARAALEQLASELHVTERVRFLGFASNPYPYMRHCRAYISSSNAEGFPNSLAEAASLEAPIIATNCHSGPSEILDEQAILSFEGIYYAKFGILTPTNDVEALAQAIRLMDNDGFRESQKQRVAHGVQRFSLADCVNAFSDLTKMILQKT